MRQNDRRLVEADEIDPSPGRRYEIGAQAEKLFEIERRLGQDREVDVAHVAPVGIHGGTEEEDELHPFVSGQYRAGTLGSDASVVAGMGAARVTPGFL